MLQGAAGLDLQWEAYFQNPGAYYDNRLTKPGPSSPDFKTKDRCGSPTLSPEREKTQHVWPRTGLSDCGPVGRDWAALLLW